MGGIGQLSDKNLPRTLCSGLSALVCGGRSFEVPFIYAIVYLKQKKKLEA